MEDCLIGSFLSDLLGYRARVLRAGRAGRPQRRAGLEKIEETVNGNCRLFGRVGDGREARGQS